jgi:hypothetical protein
VTGFGTAATFPLAHDIKNAVAELRGPSPNSLTMAGSIDD